MSETKPYHHGNLRQTLIDTGIQYVAEYGETSLTLRKLSTLCGVTHAAIYSHYKDKEELLSAMKDYVNEEFAASLEDAVTRADQTVPQEVAFALATAYVRFFLTNPHYYGFLFSRDDININFDDLSEVNAYRPFEVFKNYALAYLSFKHIPEQDRPRIIIGMWATVHGIAGIAIMAGTQYSGDWMQTTRDILKYNFQIG